MGRLMFACIAFGIILLAYGIQKDEEEPCVVGVILLVFFAVFGLVRGCSEDDKEETPKEKPTVTAPAPPVLTHVPDTVDCLEIKKQKDWRIYSFYW